MEWNASQLECQVETAFQPDCEEAWDRLAEELEAPVYMTFSWLRVWWNYYGGGRSLRLFRFFQGPSLVAAIPVYISTVGLPPLSIRVARLLGANLPPKVFNPPVPSSLALEAWGAVFRHLLVRDRCDLVSIGPVSETYGALSGLRQAGMSAGFEWVPTELSSRGVHTTYYLPSSIDELLSSIDGKERKTRKKRLRELAAKGNLTADQISSRPEVEREFETFVEQHTCQWEAEGRPGHFHAWPKALEYNREQALTQARYGRTRFFRLLLDGQVLANQYTYGFGPSLFAELPSRVTGPEWERLSLGCSSQVKLLEAAIAAGFKTMESGLGHYEYKVLLGGKEHRVLNLRLPAAALSSRARLRFCLSQRTAMLGVLDKLWYRRIAPHMPKRLRSGQSQIVLNYDF